MHTYASSEVRWFVMEEVGPMYTRRIRINQSFAESMLNGYRTLYTHAIVKMAKFSQKLRVFHVNSNCQKFQALRDLK